MCDGNTLSMYTQLSLIDFKMYLIHNIRSSLCLWFKQDLHLSKYLSFALPSHSLIPSFTRSLILSFVSTLPFSHFFHFRIHLYQFEEEKVLTLNGTPSLSSTSKGFLDALVYPSSNFRQELHKECKKCCYCCYNMKKPRPQTQTEGVLDSYYTQSSGPQIRYSVENSLSLQY